MFPSHETMTYYIIAMTFILLDLMVAIHLAKLTRWIHQFGEESKVPTFNNEAIWLEKDFPLSPLFKPVVLPTTVAAMYVGLSP